MRAPTIFVAARPYSGSIGLVDREAVEQAVAAGALQVGLAAAAVGPTGRMRRIPGFHGRAFVEALPVMVPDDRRSCSALGPVAAGLVLAGGEGGAVRLRAGQDVMPVRRVAAAADHVALFAERSLLGEVVLAMQTVDAFGDLDALGVLPGAF